MKGNLGAYLGMTIGFLGWVIGFAVVCLASGSYDALARTAPLGVLVSLGLAGTVALLMECLLRTAGRGSGVFLAALWGVLLADAGVLWLLLNHWLAPIIESDPDLLALMDRLGGVYRTSDALPAACLAVGALLLSVAFARLVGRAPA